MGAAHLNITEKKQAAVAEHLNPEHSQVYKLADQNHEKGKVKNALRYGSFEARFTDLFVFQVPNVLIIDYFFFFFMNWSFHESLFASFAIFCDGLISPPDNDLFLQIDILRFPNRFFDVIDEL